MLALARAGAEQLFALQRDALAAAGLGAVARPIAAARLIVASHNAGKVREIAALLGPLGIEAVGAGTLGLAEPEETGETFGANAALKARAAALASGEPALADDSGLVVSGARRRARHLLRPLGRAGEGLSRRHGAHREGARRARRRDPRRRRPGSSAPSPSAGRTAAARPSRGGRTDASPGRRAAAHGFGYDPIFVPEGHARSFGEMRPGEKQPLTHRARAFERLLASGLLARP